MRKTAKDLFAGGVADGGEIRAWIFEATNEELEDFIKEASVGEYQIPDGHLKAAQSALQLRVSKAALTPHWSVVPNFWVTLAAAIASLFAAWFAWKTVEDNKPAVPTHTPEVLTNAVLNTQSTSAPPLPHSPASQSQTNRL